MTDTPPETCRTLMLSSRSGVPRAGTSSRIASLGIAPVPCCEGRPTRIALHGVARRLVRRARDPADGRLIQAPTAPPIRVAPGRVHGGFHTACKRFARLVGCPEEPFSMSCAGVVKMHLFGIRHIMRQCVFDRTLRLDLSEPSQGSFGLLWRQ